MGQVVTYSSPEVGHPIGPLYLAQASDGNYRLAQILANEKEDSEFLSLKFQSWMRMCLRLDGEKLSEWITEMAAIGREKQKQFFP